MFLLRRWEHDLRKRLLGAEVGKNWRTRQPIIKRYGGKSKRLIMIYIVNVYKKDAPAPHKQRVIRRRHFSTAPKYSEEIIEGVVREVVDSGEFFTVHMEVEETDTVDFSDQPLIRKPTFNTDYFGYRGNIGLNGHRFSREKKIAVDVVRMKSWTRKAFPGLDGKLYYRPNAFNKSNGNFLNF